MIDADTFNAFIGLIFILAVPLTFVLSLIIRRLYRKGIVKAMMETSGVAEDQFPLTPATRPNGNELEFDIKAGGVRRRFRIKLGARYFLAGLAYAVVVTVVMFVTDGIEFLPVRTSVVVLSFTTPALIMGLIAAGLRWYWVIFVLVFWVWLLYQIAPESNDVIGMLAGPSALMALILANPFMRTTTVPIFLMSVALLVPLMFVLHVMMGVMLYGLPEFLVVYFPPWATWVFTVLVSLGIVLGIGLIFALLAVRFIGRLTLGSSEYVMQNDVLWAFQTIFLIALAWGAVGAVALFYILAFAAYRLVLWILKGKGGVEPELLLLLRVFGNRKSQQKLSRGRLLEWRQSGPVMLIGSADLATETLDAWELAAFLRRRLGELFINSPQDLSEAVTGGGDRLSDGLYPMQDYYCRDNSWRPTIKTLMSRASKVLLDLRGFGPENRGVQFEINELSLRVRARDITVLYDDTTDMILAQNLFREAWGAGGGNGVDTIRFSRV